MLVAAVLLSAAVHLGLLSLGLRFEPATLPALRALEVTLAAPVVPTRQPPLTDLAAPNATSGGAVRAIRPDLPLAAAPTTPARLPNTPNASAPEPTPQPEERSTEQSRSEATKAAPSVPNNATFRTPLNRAELLQRGRDLARIEAHGGETSEMLRQQSRRKVFGATARGVQYARYVEDWRLKVETIGNLNYPQAARDQGLHGSLQLLVALRADGSIERIELMRSSGHPILDEAARRIVELGAPFAPFPAELRQDTDVLEIIRTWTFSHGDKLRSE